MLYSATNIGNILLVDDMNISEKGGIFHLLSFMVMFWMCYVFGYFDRGRIFLPFISCSFGVYFSYLEGRVEYSSF